MIVNKLSALIGALALTTGSLFAGTPSAKQVVAPAPEPAQPLFGAGMHLGAHALFLTPDADLADDTWGGGVNLDYFFKRQCWPAGIRRMG